MDLKTTTRPNRHAHSFRALRQLVEPLARTRPLEILNVGPGLAIKYLGRLSDERIFGSEIFRRAESLFRRIPMPDIFFESYETRELMTALEGVPLNLTLADINPKVLRVVPRLMAPRPVKTLAVDLGEVAPAAFAPLAGAFDLVIANAVTGRVPERVRENATVSLWRVLRPGGVAMGSALLGAPDCREVPGDKRFHRKAG